MIDRANAYIDECCARFDREERDHPRYTETNIVEHDPVFREFLLYLPALQLSYDVFGPMFHLGQDKWTRKFRVDEGKDPMSGVALGRSAGLPRSKRLRAAAHAALRLLYERHHP